MSKISSRHWIILLMLMAFSSQTMAAVAMPCYLMSQSTIQVINKMEHADHSSKIHSCCKTHGHCLFTNCAPTPISYHFGLTMGANTAGVIENPLHIQPNYIVFPNFRPPILS